MEERHASWGEAFANQHHMLIHRMLKRSRSNSGQEGSSHDDLFANGPRRFSPGLSPVSDPDIDYNAQSSKRYLSELMASNLTRHMTLRATPSPSPTGSTTPPPPLFYVTPDHDPTSTAGPHFTPLPHFQAHQHVFSLPPLTPSHGGGCSPQRPGQSSYTSRERDRELRRDPDREMSHERERDGEEGEAALQRASLTSPMSCSVSASLLLPSDVSAPLQGGCSIQQQQPLRKMSYSSITMATTTTTTTAADSCTSEATADSSELLLEKEGDGQQQRRCGGRSSKRGRTTCDSIQNRSHASHGLDLGSGLAHGGLDGSGMGGGGHSVAAPVGIGLCLGQGALGQGQPTLLQWAVGSGGGAIGSQQPGALPLPLSGCQSGRAGNSSANSDSFSPFAAVATAEYAHQCQLPLQSQPCQLLQLCCSQQYSLSLHALRTAVPRGLQPLPRGPLSDVPTSPTDSRFGGLDLRKTALLRAFSRRTEEPCTSEGGGGGIAGTPAAAAAPAISAPAGGLSRANSCVSDVMSEGYGAGGGGGGSGLGVMVSSMEVSSSSEEGCGGGGGRAEAAEGQQEASGLGRKVEGSAEAVTGAAAPGIVTGITNGSLVVGQPLQPPVLMATVAAAALRRAGEAAACVGGGGGCSGGGGDAGMVSMPGAVVAGMVGNGSGVMDAAAAQGVGQLAPAHSCSLGPVEQGQRQE